VGKVVRVVTETARRVPRIGEAVLFRKKNYEFQEATVKAIAFDRDNDLSRAKLEWRGLFGRKRETWEWIFELNYLTKSTDDCG
jgi:hypothetical protein